MLYELVIFLTGVYSAQEFNMPNIKIVIIQLVEFLNSKRLE